MLIIPTMHQKALPQHNEDSTAVLGGKGGGAEAAPQIHSTGTDQLTQPQEDLLAPNQINPHREAGFRAEFGHTKGHCLFKAGLR